MKHLLNWVEIPATNLARAEKFYNTIFGGVSFHKMDMNGARYAIFPSEDQFNNGALVQSEYHTPSSDGVTIYMDGGSDMNRILQLVEQAGGEVIMPKTYTGNEAGYVGMFRDSEGNRIGLQHS